MPATHTAPRWTHAVAGAALVGVGLAGLAATWSAPALARSADAGRSHEVMHQMMDAMHGEGTADAIHDIEGADAMMDQCASMMSMMDGGMMGNGGMMGGAGMMRGDSR